jgi:integrase
MGGFRVTTIKLLHIDRFRDRHGKVRYYFRRGQGKRISLPDKPGSITFMLAYQSALVSSEKGNSQVVANATRRSFDDLIRLYFQSPSFLTLSVSSKISYRRIIDSFVRKENIGHRRVDEIKRPHVEQMLAKRIETPGAAYALLQKLRIILRYAIALGWRQDDPTLGIKRVRLGSIHSWTDPEIAAFEARWAPGTFERTAFSLLLYTGQRVSDVIRMAWNHIGSDGISVVQQKTSAKLIIPMHPELQEVLHGWPRSHFTILTSPSGRSFSSSGYFSTTMGRAIDSAGLGKRCVPHGLRKAAARRLAEAGCTVHEIQAITGHAALSEVARYTKAAEQRVLASSAVARLTQHSKNKKSQT